MAGARWDDALARVHFEHWGRILGRLTARHGRVDLAEDALAEAFAQAAEQWRREVPRNPPGWITTTAERRLLDLLRAEAVRRRKAPLLLEPDPPGADHEPAPAEAGQSGGRRAQSCPGARGRRGVRGASGHCHDGVRS